MQLSFNRTKQDIFACLNTDIKFYKLKPIQCSLEEYNNTLSSLNPFETLSFDASVKCIDWRYSSNPNNIVSLGLSDGRVLIRNISDDKSDFVKSHIGKDRLPKHNKPCSSMQWSREYTNLIAVGFEKPDKSIKYPCALNVYDVNFTETIFDNETSKERNQTETHNDRKSWKAFANKSIHDLQCDTVNSLAWLHHHTLMAGLGKKGVKIFDLKDHRSTPVNSSIANNATYGICIDPCCETRIASYHGQTVVIWDARNLSSSLLNILSSGTIKKIDWSSNEQGQLVVQSLRPDEMSPSLLHNQTHVYDVRRQIIYNNGESKDSPCNLFKKTIKTSSLFERESTSTLAWLPMCNNMLLVASNEGSFKVASVPERTLASLQNFDSVGIFQKNIVTTFPVYRKEEGITYYENLMKKRCKSGNYGLLPLSNTIDNVELSLEDASNKLNSVWRWMHLLYMTSHYIGLSSKQPLSKNHHANQGKRSFNANKQVQNTDVWQQGDQSAHFLDGILFVLEESKKQQNVREPIDPIQQVQWKGVSKFSGFLYTNPERL